MKVQVLFKYNIVIILMVLLTLYFNHNNKLFSSSEEPIAFVMKDDSKNDEIFIINPVAGNISQYTKHRLQPRELIWSPTREYIAFIGSSKPGVTTDLESLYLLDTTNQQISKLTDFKFPASHGGWSLDGKKLYWISEGHQIRVLVFQENQLKEEHKDITLKISPFQDRSVKFQLFDGLERSNYEIVLIENGAKNRLTTNKVMDVFPALSPNGQNVAFVSEINSLPQIVVVNMSGQNTQVLTKFTNNRFPRMLAWAPAIAWINSSARKTSSHE